jgi:hypothetical protein
LQLAAADPCTVRHVNEQAAAQNRNSLNGCVDASSEVATANPRPPYGCDDQESARHCQISDIERARFGHGTGKTVSEANASPIVGREYKTGTIPDLDFMNACL